MCDEVLAWLSVLSMVQMILRIVQLMPLSPLISCFIKIQIGLTFPIPACTGCPGKVAVKRVSSAGRVRRSVQSGSVDALHLTCLVIGWTVSTVPSPVVIPQYRI